MKRIKRIPSAFSNTCAGPLARKPAPTPIIYFGADDCLYCLIGEQEPLDSCLSINKPIKSMTISNGVLYYSSVDTIYSYNPETKKHEKLTPADELISCMIQSSGIIYYGSGNNIYSFSPTTNERKQVVSVNDVKGITESNGIIYYGCSEHRYYVSAGSFYRSAFYSYNPATKEREVLVFTNRPIVCMTELDGILYYGSCGGGVNSLNYLRSYDTETKKEESIRTNESIDCITHFDSILYYGSYNGLYSYNPQTDKRKRLVSTSKQIECIIVGHTT